MSSKITMLEELRDQLNQLRSKFMYCGGWYPHGPKQTNYILFQERRSISSVIYDTTSVYISTNKSIDDDSCSLLICTWQRYAKYNYIEELPEHCEYVKYLVRQNHMAQFIYDLLVDKKVNNMLMYKNVKKIVSSSYAARLYDIDIILCDH